MPPVYVMTARGLVVGEHTSDSLSIIAERLEAGDAILLDVREKVEWDAGHLSQARWLPLSEIQQKPEQVARSLPADQIIYTHCRAGHRSVAAAEMLKPFGLDVRALAEGYQELRTSPLESDPHR